MKMVATRGNKEEEEYSGRPVSRETRKASRGALEEPEDEIYWDSDEAKLTSLELNNIGQSLKKSGRRLSLPKKKSKDCHTDSMSPPGRRLSNCSPKEAVKTPTMPGKKGKKSLTNGTDTLDGPEVNGLEATPATGKRQAKRNSKKHIEEENEDKEEEVQENGGGGEEEEDDMEVQEEENHNDDDDDSDVNEQELEEMANEEEEEEEEEVEEEDKDEEESDENEKSVKGSSRVKKELKREIKGKGYRKTGLTRSSKSNSQSWVLIPRRRKRYGSKNSIQEGSRYDDGSDEHSDDDNNRSYRQGRFGRTTRPPKRYQDSTEEEEEVELPQLRKKRSGMERPSLSPRRTRAANVFHRRSGLDLRPSRFRKRRAEYSNSDSFSGDEMMAHISTGGRRKRKSKRRRERRVIMRDNEMEEEQVERRIMGRRRKITEEKLPKRTVKREEGEEEEDDEVEDAKPKTRRGKPKVVKKEDNEEKESDENNENTNGDTATDSNEEQESKDEDVPAVRKTRRRRLNVSVSEEEEEEEEEEGRGTDNKRKLLDPVLRNEDCVKFAESLNSYNGKKRTRRPVMRFSYSTDGHRSDRKSDESDSSPSTSNSEDMSKSSFQGYSLRRNTRKKERELRIRNHVPSSYIESPARKNVVSYKRRTTTHNKSSTSCSSGVDDEGKFEKRREKSNAKARSTMLPMNLNEQDTSHYAIRERSKIGSSLADVEPMMIDKNVTFATVGGLNNHLRSLREMVVLPLLYPEVFSKFNVTPPRGVLFYGPPGTGKTLVARALANECSKGDKKVAFFMRKGADCLSKWVGESERQLRLLFDQAYQMRPSILFFDEIDGLAPVRSSRQDQIHSSIVSTLLALMDGLDSRGEIIIIGATNRIEAIDPALRRPGRFDRELCFPLPTVKAREQILSVHTSAWSPVPKESLLSFLAEHTPGYCGADLKSLCCEAVLTSLRTKYPQVYESTVKLELDMSKIEVNLKHFRSALSHIIPAGQRSRVSVGKRLHPSITPLLSTSLDTVLKKLEISFPHGLSPVCDGVAKRVTHSEVIFRPRLLIVSSKGQGASNHLAPAVIHAMEKVPVHKLDLASLYNNASKSPEEAVAQIFHEACSRPPSILYVPCIDRWFESNTESVRATFLTLLDDVDPSTPLLFLATSHTSLAEMEEPVSELFSSYRGEVFHLSNPSKEERQSYFKPLFYTHMTKIKKKVVKQRTLEPLPVAQVIAPRQLSHKELQRLVELEEATLRELRIFLRQIGSKLIRNRQFYYFSEPVNTEDVPDYLDIITNPMDLETMMSKIDRHKYVCAQDFLKDIDLIVSNALEYNPSQTYEGKHVRHSACALKDTAYTLIKTEMDTDFEEKCRDIRISREKRDHTNTEPDFVYTEPVMKDTPTEKSEKGSEGKKRKRKRVSSWCRGVLNKKPKKRIHLDKSTSVEKSKEESSDGSEDTAAADSTTVANGEVSVSEESSEMQTNKAEISPNKSLGCSTLSPPGKKPIASSSTPVANAVTSDAIEEELEESFLSSSEREENELCDDSSLVLDTSHRNAVFANCVRATDHSTVSQLQMLYTALMRLVRRHATNSDKGQLLLDTEEEIRNFVQHHEETV